MTRVSTWIAAAAVALTATACASSGGVQTAPAAPEQSPARVEVTNNNWADMRVYAERGGMTVRLGTVSSMSTTSFRIPKSMMHSTGAMRLVAHPLASRERHVSSPINVWPGQRVEFRIENHLAVSSVAVW